MNDHTQYMQKLMVKKAQITNKIEKIEKLLTNEESLENEYEKRNKKLSLDKKIFSKRILFKILEEEKKEYIKQKEELSIDIGFNQFVQIKEQIKNTKKKYEILDKTKEDENELNNKIQKVLMQTQKIFLDCFEIQIENIKTKEEIISKIKIFRYYLEIYVKLNKKIKDKEELELIIIYMKEKILKKAIELNAIAKLDLNILLNIFDTKIINLSDVNFKIVKLEKEKYILEIYDEDILDEKKQLDIKTNIKLNKKIKILN